MTYIKDILPTPKKEGIMERKELKEVLELVKDKLSRDTEAGCGIFWADAPQPTTKYAVGEEDATTLYSVGEEDVTTLYSVGEED
jgi:hypothetical protein